MFFLDANQRGWFELDRVGEQLLNIIDIQLKLYNLSKIFWFYMRVGKNTTGANKL